MKLIYSFRAIGFALFILFISSCKKDDAQIAGNGNITFEFDHVVGTQALQLNTGSYVNANGDDYKVTTFKYYASNFTFIKADGSKVSVPESYLLVNASDVSTKLQTLSDVPAGDYTAVEFIVGVDEARNFAGAQTGVLDPAKGMFWSWNTGYIFLMFEGSSSKSTQATNKLFFHVGGAKAPANAIRTIKLQLPTTLRVRENTNPDVHFFVDVASLFKGTTTINFATLNGFHGGANGLLVADNYAAGLFKIDHIHN